MRVFYESAFEYKVAQAIEQQAGNGHGGWQREHPGQQQVAYRGHLQTGAIRKHGARNAGRQNVCCADRQAQAIRGHDTRDRLAKLRMPTLITTGTEDILVPPSASDDLHERIVGSELVRIPEAGHMHFLEQAPAFNETILSFLRRHLN